MYDKTLNLARVRGAIHLGRLRLGQPHHDAVARWRDRSLLHYHVQLRGVAVGHIGEAAAAVQANSRVLSDLLPRGSQMVVANGHVEDGKLTVLWCVRSMPGLKLPAWAGFTIELMPKDDAS